MNKRHIFTGVALCAVLLRTFAQEGLRGPEAVPNPRIQRQLTVAVYDRDFDLNPHTANYNTEAQLLGALYEGLFSYDPQELDPVPALAESYEVSADRKKWTFHLRDNAMLSDGTAIAADTVRDSWMALLEEKDAPFASLLDCIKGAQAYRLGKGKAKSVGIKADGNVLTLTLAEPTEYLCKILCHHAFAVTARAGVYSGPFVLKSRSKTEILFEKNTRYWDSEHVYLPSIRILLSDDESANSLSFNAGECDWIAGSFDASALLNADALKLAAQFGTSFLFFKNRSGSVWNDAQLRTALLAAVPWDRFRSGQLIPATTLLYPLDGYPQLRGIVETDVERAKELLAAAKKRLKIPADKALTVTIAVSNLPFYRNLTDVLISAWEAVGVTVKVQKTPEDRYLESIPGWDADIFSYSWIGDFADPMAFLELFRGKSSLNVSGWENKRYDQLLKNSSTKTDLERLRILGEAEELLLNDGEILPIGHSINANVIDLSTIGGWYINSMDLHPFKCMYIKESSAAPLPNLVMAE